METLAVIIKTKPKEINMIPLSLIAVVFGAFFENWRLSNKLKTLLYSILGAFLLSLTTFIPGKHEYEYVFNNHLELWPYFFLFFFLTISIVVHKDKTIPRLNEGITLVQSLAIIYWIIDFKVFQTSSSILIFLIILGLLLSFFSLLNAFTNIELTRTIRFILSLWISIIMILLAIDNIYNIYSNYQIDDSSNILDKLLYFLEYFLLGVCSIYIFQNAMMVLLLIPNKNNRIKDIVELANDHINRFSDNQINILYSIVLFIVVSAFFVINYYLNIFSRTTAIWIVFFILGYLFNYMDKNK